jgi:glycerol uptake facilitator-like aquaporin
VDAYAETRVGDHPAPDQTYGRHDRKGYAMPRRNVRAWVSEFAGTTILVFASVVQTRWVFGPNSPLADAAPSRTARLVIVAAITGLLLVLLLVSPIGRSSGGHFNPAVSVVFWLVKALPGRDLIAYVVAQLAGSVVGVLLARMLLGAVVADPGVDYAAIHSPLGWTALAVFAAEAVLLVVLMAIVMVVLSRPALARWTPLVVCAVVGLLIVVGGQISGASFNPARQFGPLLFAREWRNLWPYVFGPLAGGVGLAVAVRLFGITRPVWCSLCGEPPRDLPAIQPS